jgi:hypothetical protein
MPCLVPTVAVAFLTYHDPVQLPLNASPEPQQKGGKEVSALQAMGHIKHCSSYRIEINQLQRS